MMIQYRTNGYLDLVLRVWRYWFESKLRSASVASRFTRHASR